MSSVAVYYFLDEYGQVHCKLIKDEKYFCGEVCTSYKYNGLKKKLQSVFFTFTLVQELNRC